MNPKVSIIVPVYNVEKYLDRCMDSLLNQTLTDIEIILVDDESPDRCPQMCDEYARKDSRVKVIHKKNGGLGFARNSGLELATGDYVAFCDSDDFIDTDAYHTAYNECVSENLDILGFGYNRFSNDDQALEGYYPNTFKIYKDKESIRKCAASIFGDVPGYETKSNYIVGSACMTLYRRSVIETNNLRFYSEREYISEDYLFNFEYLQYVMRAGRCDNTWYHYRCNPQSLSRVIRLDRLKKCEKYSRFIEEIMQKYSYGEDAVLFSMANYLAALRVCQKSIFLSDLSYSEKRTWFVQSFSTDILDKIISVFPIYDLPINHVICVKLNKYRCFVGLMLYYKVIQMFRNE